jgi:hypothetical protein
MIVCGIIVTIATAVFHFGGPKLQLAHGIKFPLVSLAATELLTAAAVVLITIGFVVSVDRRPVITLGLNRCGSWIKEMIFGIVLGFGLIGLMFLVSWLAGWSRPNGSIFMVSPGYASGILAVTLILSVSIGVAEEVSSRGYILPALKHACGTIPALITTSVLFSLLHMMNPGAGMGCFFGVLSAGFLLGYAYLATGRLWMPVAFHFAWDFAEGPIFGFPVSGYYMPAWIGQTYSGPAIWTGGRFGPEAGLMMPIAALIGILAIWLFRRYIYRAGAEDRERPR